MNKNENIIVKVFRESNLNLHIFSIKRASLHFLSNFLRFSCFTIYPCHCHCHSHHHQHQHHHQHHHHRHDDDHRLSSCEYSYTDSGMAVGKLLVLEFCSSFFLISVCFSSFSPFCVNSKIRKLSYKFFYRQFNNYYGKRTHTIQTAQNRTHISSPLSLFLITSSFVETKVNLWNNTI